MNGWLGWLATVGSLGFMLAACTETTVASSDFASLANAAPSYMLYGAGGTILSANDSEVRFRPRSSSLGDAQRAVRLHPIAADPLSNADTVVLGTANHRFVTLREDGRTVLLGSSDAASVWRVTRTAGIGQLTIGESFMLSAEDGSLLTKDDDDILIATSNRDMAILWTLGCDVAAGPHGAEWADRTSFEVATDAHAERVAGAVAWLVDSQRNVQLPVGDLPLIVWDDPTLSPESTVAYLMTDTLWAAKALTPYAPDLAEAMQMALRALGWYGNGLADTLFHGLPAPAHRPTSSDAVHGTYLGSCIAYDPSSMGRTVAQLRVPEVEVDAAWTVGNSAQFVDSAAYTALNDFWNGETIAASTRLRDVIEDSRTAGTDLMFWDDSLRVLVDQSSRCEFDAFIGQCSPQCASCTPCAADNCSFQMASVKLSLLLYAARVMGLNSDATLAPKLAAMADRVWEGQRDDGGIPHALLYGRDGSYRGDSGATGEATAITVLANTVARR